MATCSILNIRSIEEMKNVFKIMPVLTCKLNKMEVLKWKLNQIRIENAFTYTLKEN